METATIPTPTKPKVKSPTIVRGRGRKELHSADVKIDQASPIRMPVEGPMAHPSPDLQITPPQAIKDKDYLDLLKFNEDPVTILVAPSSEEHAALFIEAWCNGKGIEVWDERRQVWKELFSIPTGVKVTVKRKYVEILARAKRDKVKTIVYEPQGPDGDFRNQVERVTLLTNQISVLHDPAGPRGYHWLQEILSNRA